jgi:hypothetical protein
MLLGLPYSSEGEAANNKRPFMGLSEKPARSDPAWLTYYGLSEVQAWWGGEVEDIYPNWGKIGKTALACPGLKSRDTFQSQRRWRASPTMVWPSLMGSTAQGNC